MQDLGDIQTATIGRPSKGVKAPWNRARRCATVVFMHALLSLLLLTAPAEGRPAVGDTAPAFKLPATDGRTISLADFKGKKTVVLAFFPKAFTGG